MKRLLNVLAVITCFGMATLATAGGMPKSFTINLDNQTFTITPPKPPENEFVKYLTVISLQDEKLFEKSNSVVGLQVHWTYRRGFFRTVAGVIEMRVIIRVVPEYDLISSNDVEAQVNAYFTQEFTKAGLAKPTQICTDEEVINDRSWWKYQVPVIGVLEYSTVLSNQRFLTTQFSFIDNTGEASPGWHQEADVLMKSLVESMRLQ